jgi:PAS domain S-box-containing protein
MMPQASSRRNAAARSLPIATAAMAAGIFIADCVLPHDLAVGVAYIVVVLTASRFCTGRTLVLVGAGCMALTILGYLLSPPLGPTEHALVNVTVRSAAIGGATLLAWQTQSAHAAAHERGNLLDLTHDTIFVRGMDDVITYWNRGAEDLYGWTRDEAIGKVSYLLLQTIFPDAREKISAELLRTSRWEGELIHTKRDGTSITVASRWALERDEHGRPARILETNNDVTARKRAEQVLGESEAKLEEAQRIARIGWWERDFRTKHVSLSDEVCRIFGVQPMELPQWQGRWLEVMHPEDRARVAEASAAAVRGGPRYDVEYRVVRPDGTYASSTARET